MTATLGTQSPESLLELAFAVLPLFREVAKLNARNCDTTERELLDFYRAFNADAWILMCLLGVIHRSVPASLLSPYISKVLDRLEFLIDPSILHRSVALVRDCQIGYQKLPAFRDRFQHLDKRELVNAEKHVHFGSLDSRGELVDAMKECAVQLETEFPNSTNFEFVEAVKPSRRRPVYDVWGLAESMYHALCGCQPCPCHNPPQYGAGLALATHHISGGMEGTADFEILLSVDPAPCVWQEARVNAVSISSNQTKTKEVKFDVPVAPVNNNAKQWSKRKAKCEEIRSLCETIKKARQSGGLRLDLTVENRKLWRSQSTQYLPSSTAPQQIVTLGKLLLAKSAGLTDLTKRVIAVILAYSVLHLYKGSWLQGWDKEDVFFIRSDSTIPLKLYLSAHLHSSENKESSDSDWQVHPYPNILALGTILLELHLGQTIESFVALNGLDEEEVNINTPWIRAKKSLDKFRTHLFPKYRSAVEACLDPNFGADEDYDEEGFRRLIYKMIVKPLEDELEDGFGDWGSIEELDKNAPTLDLGSFGQTILDQSPASTAALPSTAPCRPTTLKPHDIGLNNFSPCVRASTAAANSTELDPAMENSANYPSFALFDHKTLSRNISQEACDLSDNWFTMLKEEVHSLLVDNLDDRSRAKIAILDTGIDLSHIDMQAQEERIKSVRSWVGGGNGKEDRKGGDWYGHGTHAAGLLLDIAPQADIYIARIAEGGELKPTDQVADLIADAIRVATTEWKVDIITMSFGFPYRIASIEAAIRDAHHKNIIIFAAARNDGGNRARAYPAKQSEVIGIHFANGNGQASDYNPRTEIGTDNFSTLGEAVESAWPGRPREALTQRKSGTSFATPIAAGIAAFILEYARQKLPQSETVARLKSCEGMKEAFRLLAGNPDKDGYQYVAPWYFFRKTEEKIQADLLEALR